MRFWNDYFYGPVAAIRPYLFQKCLLLVVGTDALVLMTERGSRYGIDGFNVAHFQWLDAIHPVPTATWYVGVLMVLSLLAYTICFTGPSRVLLAILAVLNTYAWAMSRHDSYMHHYMLSLIMLCMVFFPKITYADLLPVYRPGGQQPRKRRSGARHDASQGPTQPGDSPIARGGWFVLLVLGLGLIYRTVDVLAVSWIALFAYALVVALLVAVFLRRSQITSGPLTSAWAYRLLGATVGVIYVYTSAAKADAQWCGGYTLKQVGNTTEVLAPFVQLAEAVGVPADWFWAIAATAVIPLELTISASYFLAVRQDEPKRKWTRIWCCLAWLLAIGLHLNNEMMNLSIQWFGYYMMFLAMFFFLPERVLLALGACIVLPAHWWNDRVARPMTTWSKAQPLHALAVVTGGMALILAGTSRFIGLPGALWALPVAAAVIIVYAAIMQLRSADALAQKWLELASAAGLAGLAMAAVVSQSSMRHDYYWILGTEYQQHLTARLPEEAHARALAAYELADDYGAPDKERQVKLLINMGLAHSRMNQFPEAIERYQQALEVDPGNAHAYFNMGVTFQVAGDLSRAADMFRQAIDRDKEYLIAYRELGRTQELLGDLVGALQTLRRIQKLRPNDQALQQDIARLIRATRQTTPEPQQHAKSG